MQKIDTDHVKDLYNKKVPGQFQSEYEHHRWFSNYIKKAGYTMTKTMIERHALTIPYQSYLELGPGAGTWTKLFVTKNTQASYHLLDISEEMLKLAKQATQKAKNITYTETDFLKFEPKNQYDLFFSSRAIEYLPDREKMIKTITNSLKSGGQGFLITKTPKYLRAKLLRKKISKFHSAQIPHTQLKKLLKKYGCTDIKIYPVTFSMPFLKSPKANLLLFKLLSPLPFNPISHFFSESYCVKFRKI